MKCDRSLIFSLSLALQALPFWKYEIYPVCPRYSPFLLMTLALSHWFFPLPNQCKKISAAIAFLFEILKRQDEKDIEGVINSKYILLLMWCYEAEGQYNGDVKKSVFLLHCNKEDWSELSNGRYKYRENTVQHLCSVSTLWHCLSPKSLCEMVPLSPLSKHWHTMPGLGLHSKSMPKWGMEP